MLVIGPRWRCCHVTPPDCCVPVGGSGGALHHGRTRVDKTVYTQASESNVSSASANRATSSTAAQELEAELDPLTCSSVMQELEEELDTQTKRNETQVLHKELDPINIHRVVHELKYDLHPPRDKLLVQDIKDDVVPLTNKIFGGERLEVLDPLIVSKDVQQLEAGRNQFISDLSGPLELCSPNTIDFVSHNSADKLIIRNNSNCLSSDICAVDDDNFATNLVLGTNCFVESFSDAPLDSNSNNAARDYQVIEQVLVA